MALYRLSMKICREHVTAKVSYILREGKYAKGIKKEDLRESYSKNLPAWADDKSLKFWRAIENGEKPGQVQARAIELALPVELSKEEQKETVNQFCEKCLQNHALTFAIHDSKDGKNPHVHIYFCERKIDERKEPNEKDYCKQRKGYSKDREITGKNRTQWLQSIRKKWEIIQNLALEKAGKEVRVSCLSLEAQGIDREPEIHVGAKEMSRYKRTGEKGERLQRNESIKEQNKELSILETRLKEEELNMEQAKKECERQRLEDERIEKEKAEQRKKIEAERKAEETLKNQQMAAYEKYREAEKIAKKNYIKLLISVMHSVDLKCKENYECAQKEVDAARQKYLMLQDKADERKKHHSFFQSAEDPELENKIDEAYKDWYWTEKSRESELSKGEPKVRTSEELRAEAEKTAEYMFNNGSIFLKDHVYELPAFEREHAREIGIEEMYNKRKEWLKLENLNKQRAEKKIEKEKERTINRGHGREMTR